MSGKILLVEDEVKLQEIIRLNLEMEGYHVFSVNDGKAAVKKFGADKYDLVILDVMLPQLDGFSVCESIRKSDQSTPVLFLSAKGTGQDKIHGLKLGGDDYLTKPFHLEEFLLRVQKLIQRSKPQGKEHEIFEFGDNQVNFQTFEIRGTNNLVKTISKKEILLLKLLVHKNNQVVSRDEILNEIWGYDVYPTARTIDNYILAFRKYFEKNPRIPRYFHSIRGVGYKFTC